MKVWRGVKVWRGGSCACDQRTGLNPGVAVRHADLQHVRVPQTY